MIEVVSGTIIGEATQERPYIFYSLEGQPITGVKWFADDEAAIAWFKKGWPGYFKTGAEMRVWDRP